MTNEQHNDYWQSIADQQYPSRNKNMIPKIPLITTKLASLEPIKAMLNQNAKDNSKPSVDLNKEMFHELIKIVGAYQEATEAYIDDDTCDKALKLIEKCERMGL